MHMDLKCHLWGALGILYSPSRDRIILLWVYATYEILVFISVVTFVSSSQQDSD